MLLDGGKKGIGPLRVGSGIEKRRKVMRRGKKENGVCQVTKKTSP